MKASGLFLAVLLVCAACTTHVASPHTGEPLDRYGGPPQHDIENFDRAALPSECAPSRA